MKYGWFRADGTELFDRAFLSGLRSLPAPRELLIFFRVSPLLLFMDRDCR